MDGIHQGACSDHPFAAGDVSDRDERFGRANAATVSLLVAFRCVVSPRSQFPKVVRPMWIDFARSGEGLSVRCNRSRVVDIELQPNFGHIEEAAVVPAVDSILDDSLNQGR